MKKSQSHAQNVEKASLRLDWATHEAAKYACENWHYSGCMPTGKTVKIGVWENGKYKGVIIFSYGANNNSAKYFSLTQQQVCELTRVALDEHETEVSRMLSLSLKFLKKQSPGIRVVFSYSDKSGQSHHGGIYQANGWLYLGERSTSDKGAYYVIRGKEIHGRSARAKYGTESRFPKPWYHSPSKTKHLYVKVIDDKYTLTHKTFLYPKRAVNIDNDVPANHAGEGGVNPTTALQNSI